MITVNSKKGKIEMPCMDTILVKTDMVQANDYNPNNVPKNNMKLLEESIMTNGFCFPVVTIWDEEAGKYIIVDGAHRHDIFANYLKAEEIGIVVLNQSINERRTATIQFNKARGVHQVEDMGDLVKAMVDDGATDEDLATSLGMDQDEILRLKQITGSAELFQEKRPAAKKTVKKPGHKFPTVKSEKGEVKMPCLEAIIVPIEQVQANDYNPNRVAKKEMKMLEDSILHNGFCFPVVTIWDEEAQKYIIVDGFHRYTIFKDYLEADELAIIVLDEDINQRRAATVQFNRARGVHQVETESELISAMFRDGMKEEEIAKAVGITVDDVLRMKDNTGIAELYKNQPWSKSWEMEEIDEMAI